MSTPSTHGVTADMIEAALTAALHPESVQVTDDSHLHAGHAGAREGRHFSVSIVASCFGGMGPVQRHRLVYDALRDLIPRGIHALAIKAELPTITSDLHRAPKD